MVCLTFDAHFAFGRLFHFGLQKIYVKISTIAQLNYWLSFWFLWIGFSEILIDLVL